MRTIKTTSIAEKKSTKEKIREIIKRPKEKFLKNTRPLPSPNQTLQVLELSDYPFAPDQVFALSRAGVLAGVHGAGLANAVLMEPGAGAVLEVWLGMEDNFHYGAGAHCSLFLIALLIWTRMGGPFR